MKRASTRFWLCANSFVLAALPALAQRGGIGNKYSSTPFRSNEFRLAGLRPGKSSEMRAASQYKAFGKARSENGSKFWIDPDACEKVNVDLDARGIVQSIRVTVNVFNGQKGCAMVVAPAGWSTGRGLALRSSCGEASKIYGEPTSRSPSTKNGQPLELLYYAFDWAGPDVPQVMEVVCSAPNDGKPGRVVEITLAAGSL